MWSLLTAQASLQTASAMLAWAGESGAEVVEAAQRKARQPPPMEELPLPPLLQGAGPFASV